MKFRKKPVVIDAVMWDGTEKCLERIALPFLLDGHEDFCHLPFKPYFTADRVWNAQPDGVLYIPTLEGTMAANPGDWIIRGVAGEFYPCKPDIFEQTYEATDDN